MMAANRGAFAQFAPAGVVRPNPGTAISMGAHLVMLAWSIGAIGLLAGAMAKRRVSALGPVAIAVVALYLFDFLASSWRPLAVAAVISPFHYYQGVAVFAGTANSYQDFLVLGSMTVAATTTAYWRFNLRDV